jgi:uncharacterized protein (DUF4415 family)
MPMKKRAGASVWVDPDDAAELTDDFFDRAEIREGERVIRRGRPPLPAPKQAVTVRLEPELLARLRASGPGWQSRLNEAVREWLAKQPG